MQEQKALRPGADRDRNAFRFAGNTAVSGNDDTSLAAVLCRVEDFKTHTVKKPCAERKFGKIVLRSLIGPASLAVSGGGIGESHIRGRSERNAAELFRRNRRDRQRSAEIDRHCAAARFVIQNGRKEIPGKKRGGGILFHDLRDLHLAEQHIAFAEFDMGGGHAEAVRSPVGGIAADGNCRRRDRRDERLIDGHLFLIPEHVDNRRHGLGIAAGGGLREWVGIVQYVIFFQWNSQWDARQLLKFPLRFIFIDCIPTPDSAPFHCFLPDRAKGVESAVLEFLKYKRRRIALVNANSGGRVAGFTAAIRKAETPVETLLISAENLEFADGYRAGKELVGWKADAVFSATDRMALGFYRYAHENGIRIPEDIAVAGFDNDNAGEFAIPILTSVAHPIAEVVDAAVSLITAPLEREPATVYFPLQLVARESIC